MHVRHTTHPCLLLTPSGVYCGPCMRQVYKVGSVLTSVLMSGLVYLITSTQALVASQVRALQWMGRLLSHRPCLAI